MAANTHSIDLEEGSSHYLAITDANQTNMDMTGDWTVEMWVNVESEPGEGENDILFAQGKTTDDQIQFDYRKTSGTLNLRLITSDNGTDTVSDTINHDLGTATWVHIALTYDVSAGQGEIFIDGSSIGTLTGLDTTLNSSAGDFAIGAIDNSGTYTAFFDGKIDEVRIWDDIRTDAEISNNQKVDVTGEANLVAYWKLNNALTDETSNGNDLTNPNSAPFSTTVPFSNYAGEEENQYAFFM